MKFQDITRQLPSTLEARILIKHITGLSDSDLITLDSIPFTPDQFAWLNDAISQCQNGRPVSKIIGKREFYGRDFIVTDDVLDPRPETELIIDAVLNHVQNKSDHINILDLGCGSGCISLTLLCELSNTTATLADISDKALAIAQKNAEQLGVSNRANFVASDWFSNIDGQYDIIVTNPPYIETRTLADLDKNVTDYDPHLALDGGEDGLTPYKVILPQIRTYLKKDGFFMCEHGTGQSGDIVRLIENAQLSQIRVHHDLAGHDRAVSCIRE